MASRKIKKILVPLDGSKHSMDGLHKAIEIAKPFGARITGLCVIPSTPPIPLIGSQPSFKSYMTDGAAKTMAEAKKVASRNDVEFHGKLVYGDASLEIANFANAKKYDLVVIGSRGRSGLKELFLGSVANATVHRSQVPVLVIK
ncbi:MAG: universal stress protein [Thaumarchaeota archaeon]|nr:universal stress protein [Nitrososphaerota archaeon]